MSEKTILTKGKAELASKYFKEGYNCAQSVCLAFSDELNLDCETLLKLSSSFGGGMGRLREVCGAVSAMFMIAGLLKGYNLPNNDTLKAAHYARIQALAQEFKACHKTIICRELLGLEKNTAADFLNHENDKNQTEKSKTNDENFSPVPSKRTKEYYESRPCEAFIRTAAEIIEKQLL